MRHRAVNTLTLLLLALTLWGVILVALGGCFRSPIPKVPDLPKPEVPVIERLVTVHEYGFLDGLAYLFIFAGMLALVASAIPLLSAFIPRKAAVTAILCGFGAIFARIYLVKFAAASVWIVFVLLLLAGAGAVWPYAIAWYRRNLVRTSDHLAAQGDARAATALRVAAMPKRYRIPEARKALLATLGGKTQTSGTTNPGGGHLGPTP